MDNMIDLVVMALGLTMGVAITECLRRMFAATNPEFLPFLKVVRWSFVIGGGIAILGTLLTVIADLVGA
jgi:uncharacterized membrane protein (DUF106 family)